MGVGGGDFTRSSTRATTPPRLARHDPQLEITTHDHDDEHPPEHRHDDAHRRRRIERRLVGSGLGEDSVVRIFNDHDVCTVVGLVLGGWDVADRAVKASVVVQHQSYSTR